MVDIFRILRPILFTYFTYRRLMLRNQEKNYWKKNNLPPLKAIKPISGTFIYLIPPDYPGIKTYFWKLKEWIHEFERLKCLGIDTLILNGSVSETISGQWYVFYPMSEDAKRKFSNVEKRHVYPPKTRNCISHILQAAEQVGLNVHLGLFNVLDQWFINPTPDFLNETLEHEIAVAEDLVSLYGEAQALKGWYISPEIFYFLHGRCKKLDLKEFLQPIGHFLKKSTAKMHIGLSPGTMYPFAREKVKRFWIDALKDTGINLLYPQDSVGTLNIYPSQSPFVWKLYHEIANALKITLWANCEAFERRNFGKKQPFVAAPFKRLIWQLQTVSPFVEKIVTWEALYFLNPLRALQAEQLVEQYKQHFKIKNLM